MRSQGCDLEQVSKRPGKNNIPPLFEQAPEFVTVISITSWTLRGGEDVSAIPTWESLVERTNSATGPDFRRESRQNRAPVLRR